MEIHVKLPESFLFETSSEVRIDDINYGGHLSNEAFLKIASEARVRFLKEHGLSELDVGGVGIIMTGAMVEYLAEGFHGDRVITSLGVGEIGRTSFRLLYRLTREGDNTPLAAIRTDLSCFDYTARRVRRIPEQLREILKG